MAENWKTFSLSKHFAMLYSRDVNEPLQARGSTRSARKFRCSKVARLEIGSKIFGSIFARLEKYSKNFGSRSTLFENFWLEMLASLKRANFWKKLQEIYCQYCTWNQFWQIQNLKNNSFANLREFWMFVLHEINFDSFWVNFIWTEVFLEESFQCNKCVLVFHTWKWS